MSTFEKLQARHEDLLSHQDTEDDLLGEVRDFISQVRKESSGVISVEERDQLRANLRYWSAYVYKQTGVYPSTELAPSTTTPRSYRTRLSTRTLILLGIAIILVALLIISIRVSRFTFGAPVINSPVEGDEVSRVISVTGFVAEAALEAGIYLHIFVRPQNDIYYVQAEPEIDSDGNWRSEPVFVGRGRTIDEGSLFDICAVLVSQELKPGDTFLELPPGPSSCVTVRRGP